MIRFIIHHYFKFAMRNLLIIISLYFSIFTSPILLAGVTIQTTQVFSDIDVQVKALAQRHGAENLLIVLDIDNTLIKGSSDLGSDIWYQWQRGKLAVKPSEEQQVACLFEDAIGLLYELNPMMLTEPVIPELINHWQAGDTPIIALTSRAPKYRPATERELSNKGINLARNALTDTEGLLPNIRVNLEREVSYMQGIMMTSGQHKGKMLSWLLNALGRDFKAIVFVDDTLKNVNNVRDTYDNHDRSEVHIFHYERVEALRKKHFGSVLTQAQANQLAEDWETLTATLEQIFPARPDDDRCLTDSVR